MLKRVVMAAEVLALLAIGVFVVMLFANEPGGEGAAAGPGARIYADRCASCHGSTGDGISGPKLADGEVVEAYPDIADEIAVVTDGIPRTSMPSFEARGLSPTEIRQVVQYTRTL